ncbi:MAG: T9SS type A sorting domain-containing protein [Flavobacteriia bacterium]|jgi:polyhydroxybutyrate depolymerase
MKLFIISLLLFSTVAKAQSVVRTISVNGQSRTFRLYVPSIYNANSSVPLVFNFHGYTSNASEQELYGDFTEIADTANFILVHPNGLDIGGGLGWNSFGTTSPSNYDYLFVEQIISSLNAEFNIDPLRIYSTGMSNGGFMSYDMACFATTKFAAIASVTGSMIPQHVSLCNPNRHIPVMQIHGTNDPTVSYSGTGGILTSTNIDSLMRFWVINNETSFVPIETAVPNVNLTDNCTALHYLWENNNDNADVELFKIIGGMHTWPGTLFNSAGTNQDFSASKEIWRFFLQHSLDPNLLGNDEFEIENNIAVYPNPSSGIITLNFVKTTSGQISINDLSGKNIKSLTVKNQKEIEIDLSDLTSGIYFVNIENKQVKLVKE